ncbi:hypothetical protein HMPREF1634_04435 [Tissierellia bacterium S7-1-4]|nr:hypothetical protein HMPREF1634_04435 [Tissierellia bacterium S7-1-4]
MIYLDNAATSYPKPETVYKANDYALRNSANPGRGAYQLAMDSARMVFTCRNKIKALINAESTRNIILTKNCTEGLNIAIFGALSPGDHVITTYLEHNSILRPLHEMEERGVEVTYVEPSMNLTEDILKNVKYNTKMVAISHVDNLVGFKKDIEAIGNRLSDNILFLVDVAQSLGHEKIDVQKYRIDLCAAPGHKSLFGPMGTGFLYVKNPDTLTTFMVGGTGSESSSPVQPNFSPDKFEAGTLGVPAYAALEAGIEFVMNETEEKITKKVHTLARKMFLEFEKIDGVKTYSIGGVDTITSVVSINIKDMDSGGVSDILANKYGICTRSQMHCAPLSHKFFNTLKSGMVRFSPGYFTTDEEIEKAVLAVKEIAAEK